MSLCLNKFKYILPASECKAEGFRCKRMPESFLNHCKAALSNLIASDRLQLAEDPYQSFSDGITNFFSHYCLDNHQSSWCHHDKVGSEKKKKELKSLSIYRVIPKKKSRVARCPHLKYAMQYIFYMHA